MAPKGTSLGTALFVVAFAIWCSPVALRQWIWDYIAYVVFGQWIQFVTIYFQPWNWMHNCEFEKWFVFWFSITFTPGVIAHTVITLNFNLPYSNTPAVKGGEPQAQVKPAEADDKKATGCCSRVGKFLLSLGSAWGRFWSACFPNGCCGGRACADGLLQFWVWAGMVSTAFIGMWAYTVYQQAVCAQGDTCSDADGPVARGVVSQAQVTWWLDVVSLRPLLVLFFIVESWRVRMPLARTFFLTVLVSLGNGMGACVATPLFLIQYRNTMRANDLAFWWRRHNAAGKKDGKIVANNAAADANVEPNHDGEVDMAVVTAAVRQYMRQPGVTSTTLALDLLANPSPVNSRRFPRLEAFGLNMDWEVPAIITFLLVALHGTYVWLTAVSQQEIAGGICGLMNKQDQQFLRPAAYPMAFTPFWLFIPLMLFELSLGHFFANEYDKKLGQLPSNIATILALLVTYYNNVNVVFVFGVFSAMRLIRMRYGKAILEALTLLQPTAGFSDPMGVPGQQSVWWSSKDPDSYCAVEGADAAAAGAVAPAPAEGSSSSSSSSSSKPSKKNKSKAAVAPVDSDDEFKSDDDKAPAPAAKRVPCWLKPAIWFREFVCGVFNGVKAVLSGLGRFVCNCVSAVKRAVRDFINWIASLNATLAFVIGLIEGGALFAWAVFSSLAWGLRTSVCGGIGGGLSGLYKKWAKFWGWSPLPSPLLPERQGSLGVWMQILLAYQIYYHALCLAISLALWFKDGNSNMMNRWIVQHIAVAGGVWMTYNDIEATLPSAAAAPAASASAVAARPAASTEVKGVGSFLLSHPVFAVLLALMFVFADLLVTPFVDANEPGLNPAFRTLRISLTNLVFNYNQVGLNMAFIGVTVVGGLVLTFGTKCPLSRKNGSGLSTLRTAVLLLPIVVSLAVVWPEVMQPCPLQLGREFSTVRPSQLLANAVSTKGIVVERAFPQDTASSVTRAEAVRGAHPKEHGCVKAKLSLPYPIPSKYQHGIFSDTLRTSPLAPTATGSRQFDAFVRFSNGQFEQPNGHGGWFLQPDSTPDIRGMAVKVVLDANNTALEQLMALSPEEVAKADTDRNTQDFVTISSDYFFAKDATHFAGLTAAVSAQHPASAILEWLMPNELSWRAIKRSLSRFVVGMRAITKLTALNMAGGQVLNPRRHDYYSAVPFRMGPEQDVTAPEQGNALAVKYRWRPCEEAERSPITAKQMVGLIYVKVAKAINVFLRVVLHLEADSTLQLPIPGSDSVYVRESETAAGQPQSYLRINLQNSLSPFESQARPACFDLMIQDQRDACQNRIEDGSKAWVGEWTKVARLDIPLQLFLQTDAMQVCENLSFNPWHALAVHRPLGDVNKIRKAAYIESARTRLSLNKQKPVGPVFTGAELPVKTYPALAEGSSAAVPQISASAVPIAPSTPALLFGNPALYAYSDYPSPWERMPKKIAEAPANESFSAFTQSLIASDQLHTIFAQTITQPKVEGDEMTRLQEYEFLGLARKDEPLYENSNHALSGRLRRVPHTDEDIWTTDAFWAGQFIRGLNPMKVVKAGPNTPFTSRLRKLDAAQKASVTATLRNAGEKAASIEELIAAGRCLYADYPEIEGLMTVESRILYSPVVIFFLTESKHQMLPLLIQLENVRTCDQKPTVTPAAAASTAAPCTPYSPPLYFPAPWIPALPAGQNQTSAALQWMFAKMHASQSDGEVHQLISHLLETHLVMEATLISTHRAFSTNHVVYRLLTPHFTGTLAINEFGRMTLVSPVNPFTDVYQSIGAVGANEMMARRYVSDQYIYMETVPAQMARRGFSVPKSYAESIAAWDAPGKVEEVDGFLYKDYGLPLFYAFRNYVLSVLETEPRFAKSKSDADKIKAVNADPELYSWFNELFSPSAAGLPLRHRQVPSESWSAFVDFLAQIIFQATAQHASINFPQYDFLSFQPVRPLALQMGMPTAAQLAAGALTEEYLLHSLVHSGAIQLLQSTYDILSTCCVNTLMLNRSHAGEGLLDNAITLQPSFPKLWANLMDTLGELEVKEIARNSRRNFAYPYLYPSRVPQSINI